MSLSESDLSAIHGVLLEMLRDFDAICSELEVVYWLDGGGLVGLRRHGGMLAWDDDLDVAMTREQFRRFRDRVRGTWFDQRYSVSTADDDPNIVLVDMKIYHRASRTVTINELRYKDPAPTHVGLYLDVTVADRVSRWRWRRRLDGRTARWCDEQRRARALAANDQYSAEFRAYWSRRSKIPDVLRRVLVAWIAGSSRLRGGQRLGLGPGGLWGDQVLRTADCLPPGRAELAGVPCSVPRNIDGYLSSWHGPSYLVPPSAPEGHLAIVQLAEDADPCRAGATDGGDPVGRVGAWREVWERKGASVPPDGDVMARLLAADGFDTGFGNVDEASWSEHALGRMARLGAVPGQSVFELACGAGAFLYPLRSSGYEVGGLDFAGSLIEIASAVMPEGDFTTAEARDLAVEPTYDWVVCTSAFLYFPSLDYAEDVVRAMVAKARRGILITDIPDVEFEAEAMEMRRQVAGGAEAYDQRYAGLDHQYFARSWFADLAEKIGLVEVTISAQDQPGYRNGEHRFNVSALVAGTAK